MNPIFVVASCLGNFPDDTLICRIFYFIYDVITNRNKPIINTLTSLLVAGPLPRMVGSVWVTAQFQYRNMHSLCRLYMKSEPVWLVIYCNEYTIQPCFLHPLCAMCHELRIERLALEYHLLVSPRSVQLA